MQPQEQVRPPNNIAAGAFRPGRRAVSTWGPADWAILLGFAGLVVLFHWRLITPDLADRQSYPPGDFDYQFWAFSTFEARELSAGRLPLWNPFTYSGAPFWADVQAAVLYPPSLLTLVISGLAGGFSLFALEIEALAHFWLAATFMYLFARRVTQSRPAGLVAALVFTFSGYLTGYPSQQLAILEADIWLPLVLFFLDRAALARRPGHPARVRPAPGLADLLLAGAGWGLAIIAGHPQSAMIIGYTFTAFFVFLWRFGGRLGMPWGWWTALRAWFLVVGLGFALAAVQFLPALEYMRQSVRSGGDYERMAGGLPLVDVVQFLLPGIVSLYSPLYVGTAGLVLALVAAVGIRSRSTTFWALVGAVALFISFGGNTFLYPPLYLAGPGFGLFRGQERWALDVALSLSVLAGYGARAIVAATDSGLAAGHLGARLAGGLLLFSLGLDFLFFYGLNDTGWTPQNPFYDLLSASVLLTLVLAASWVLARAGRWQVTSRGENEPRTRRLGPLPLGLLVLAGWVGLVLFDLFSVNWETNLYPQLPEWHTRRPPVVQAIEADPGYDQGPFRVYNEFRLPGFENYGVPFELQDLWGASPLRLRRYEEFLTPPMPIERAWELLNVRYVITWRSELFLPSTIIFQEPVGQDETTYVHRLVADVVGPRAWVVHQVEMLSDPETLSRLADPDFDRRQLALVEQPLDFALASGEGSSATVTHFEPDRLIVEVVAEGDGVLVLSEIHYPGWRATVGGRPAPVFRTDYVLRGIPVPAGRSTVELTFRPTSFLVGAVVSGLALGGLVLGLVYVRISGVKFRQG